MPTFTTATVSVTIDAPPARVSAELADPTTHPEWATEFFAGPVTAAGDGEYHVTVPRMGGDTRMWVDADVAGGRIDLYLAPAGAPFGPPLPIRVIPNGDGCDVLFTLSRFPDVPDAAWEEGLASMKRELANLKARHEAA